VARREVERLRPSPPSLWDRVGPPEAIPGERRFGAGDGRWTQPLHSLRPPVVAPAGRASSRSSRAVQRRSVSTLTPSSRARHPG